MNDHQLARLEARLERLIEGAFAHLFSRPIRAQDIVLHLSRAMTGSLQPGGDGDMRSIAPDRFWIHLNPGVRDDLVRKLPDLETMLSQHVVALASDAGYRLRNVPTVLLVADPALLSTGIAVRGEHYSQTQMGTARLDRVDESAAVRHNSFHPQLVVNGEKTIALTADLVNVGRSRSNDIVIDDPHISRHHVQFRRRDGAYWVFDTNSQSGTFVNNVAVRQHALQPGDVVRIGRTQLVYLEDDRRELDGGTLPLPAQE